MKNKLRDKMLKFDGKSRVSSENYRKNFDQIFKKTVSENSQEELEPIEDFLDQAEREKKELEESYQESRRQTEERKAKERLTGPIDSFSEDLQNSIKERKEKDGS
jgi:lipid II:glycine glycyltransferase (peptidoglycan interpeptide bridge formation enzyme)